MDRLAAEWVRLAYYLPIDWNAYLKLPLHVRRRMFEELDEIRRQASPAFDQSRESRKSGLG